MKTHYDLLALERTASAEEVKRAFRREIARYHPDKVQHLGPEFQEIAATRAAELTEAYRILMDVELRRGYDEALAEGGSPQRGPSPPPPPAPPRDQTPRTTPPPSAPATDAPPAGRDTRFTQERATTDEFLKRAVLAKFTEAVEAVGGERLTKPGFDAVYRIQGRKGLFTKSDPPVTALLRVVPTVDAEAIQEIWMPATRAVALDDACCLLLLGKGLASPKELSVAVSEQRRRSRQAGPVVIPVDMRDWEALFPPDTPTIVRALLERLRSGR